MNKIVETMEMVHKAVTILIKRNKKDKNDELDEIIKDLNTVLDRLDVYNESKKTKKI